MVASPGMSERQVFEQFDKNMKTKEALKRTRSKVEHNSSRNTETLTKRLERQISELVDKYREIREKKEKNNKKTQKGEKNTIANFINEKFDWFKD